MFHKQNSMVYKRAQKTESLSAVGHTWSAAVSLAHRALNFWFLGDLL